MVIGYGLLVIDERLWMSIIHYSLFIIHYSLLIVNY